MNICVKNRGVFFLLGALLFVNFSTQANDETTAGVIDKINISKKMLINRRYTAIVSVKNTGSTTWTREKNISLSATRETNDIWHIPTATLEAGEEIKPGQFKKFRIRVKALSRTGIFSLQFELKQNNQTFGEKSEKLAIIVETRSNRVKFISQLLPNTMEAGERYSVVVQFKNNGTSTWSRAKGYKLRLKTNRKAWKISKIKMNKNEVVPAGEVVTFRFKLTAPSKPGNYPIQWQMQKGRSYFGEPTPVQKVLVTENKSREKAEFIYQDMPGLNKSGKLFAILQAGEVYPVTLTFKNNSNKTWRKGFVALSSQNPANNMTWSVDRIELQNNERIKPGGIKTFNFKIIAPLSPGIYPFQWQIVEGFNRWIGSKSDNISVTVK